jgi:hypothetical protein
MAERIKHLADRKWLEETVDVNELRRREKTKT